MNAVLLVIEDEQDIREFICKLLSDAGHSVHSATTGASGLELAQSVAPDLVVLDLNLPDIDGESVCTKLKEDLPETQVFMLTARGSSAELARGLTLGADDYLAKPFEPEVLLARIAARLRDRTGTHNKLQAGDIVLDTTSHSVHKDEQPILLSAQEFKLLHYLMSNPNRVLTREMIITRIWNTTPDIETRVVDVYVGYLRKKLGDDDVALIKSIRGFGYMLVA